jgi:hypothetical protein
MFVKLDPIPTPPLLVAITNILPLHFSPSQSYYIDNSFTPLDKEGHGNNIGAKVYNGPSLLHIAA